MTIKLILGTVQFGLAYGINNPNGKPSSEAVCNILQFAIENGIDELDTADAYGSSAQALVECFSRNENLKFKMMSKFVNNQQKSFNDYFESSCKSLGVSSLEGYYFHRFEDFLRFKDFDTVKKLKSQNKLNKLCVSLYSEEELAIAVESKEVDVIQLPFNAFDCSPKKISLLKKAKLVKKQIYARSAFLQGLFFKDINELPKKLLPLKENLESLHQLADSHGFLMEELCLNFVVEQEFIDKVIIGVDTVNQLQQNIQSLQKKLSPAVMNEIFMLKISHRELLNPANWNNL